MGDHDRDGEESPSEDRSSHEPGGEHDREHHEAGDEGRIEQSVLEDEAEDAGAAHRTGDARREPGGGHGHHDHGDHGDHGGMHAGHERMFRRRFFVSTLLSVPVIYFSDFVQRTFGYTAPTVPGVEWVVPAFAAIVFLYGGVPFLRMAVPELRDRSPGMMTLISMAIAVAFVYSLATVLVDRGEPFFWELVTLIDVMLLGHWIEMRSVRRASSALDELAKLMPDTAERITASGDTEEVSVSELSEGDLVLVRPGASVPADGVVEEGDSDVNEAMITGESKPVSKEPGDEVIGGTVNGDGSLRVRVDAIGEDTTLARIMRLVEEARSSKSKTQVLADRAAGWLFYAALAAAAVTAVAWTVATTFGADVVARTVTVLVIACPHALGLAIPLVVAINTSVAARNGMLVRDRIAMEDARTLDVIVFDKTGTLTEGEHGVVGQATVDGVDEDEALALAAAVEADSEHVIARAIGEAADDRGVDVPDTADFEAIKGRGVRAFVDVSGESGGSSDASDGGQEVYVGGPNLLNGLESDVPSELQSFTEQAGANARTVVYLVREGELLAAFALADVIREESYRVVDALHDLDIEVAMLTGDSRDVADAVADELGIDTVFAEVLPEDKDEKVQELQDRGKLVGMVGDGVNDAPALTRADVGIAIGSGTDVAVQSADVVLVQNDPMDVVRLVKLSRASYRKMQENIVWAAGYNVFAIPAAAGVLAPVGVLLSPAVGALLMSLSTVIVAINAQLLRRVDLSVPGLPDVSPATDARPAD